LHLAGEVCKFPWNKAEALEINRVPYIFKASVRNSITVVSHCYVIVSYRLNLK